jgi:hypothetical protein
MMSDCAEQLRSSSPTEPDENCDSSEGKKLREILLYSDISAVAIMLAMIATRSGHWGHSYLVRMFTTMAFVFLTFGGTCLVVCQWLIYRLRNLRDVLRDNDALRSDGDRSFEEWKRIHHLQSSREWPMVCRFAGFAGAGIEFSLTGLGLFAVWTVCAAVWMLR